MQGSRGSPFCAPFTKIRGILITDACYYQTLPGFQKDELTWLKLHTCPLQFSALPLVLDALLLRTEAPDTVRADAGSMAGQHIVQILRIYVFSLEYANVKVLTDLQEMLE